jgi:2-dehydropantoate 2-reductase
MSTRTELRAVLSALASEAVAVGRAAGMDVALAEREQEIHRVLAAAGPGKASMLQDIEAGRATEIDAINGAVVSMGHLYGVPTPVNAAMVALVKAIGGSSAGHRAEP